MKRIICFLLAAGTLLVSACGGKTAAPKEPPVLTGDWKETGDKSAYHYAIITGNTIEIYAQSADTRSLYWAGTFIPPETAEEPYTWTSEADRTKLDRALFGSQSNSKDFTYEKGILSYPYSIMGVESIRKLEKVSDTPSEEKMVSTVTVTEAQLLQPEVLEVGGGFRSKTSSYLQFAALVKNPNEDAAMQFVHYTVSVKDASGKVIAVNESVSGELLPGETALINGQLDVSSGVPADIQFTAVCNKRDFMTKYSVIPSDQFYFRGVSVAGKQSNLSIIGTLLNNSNTYTSSAGVQALFRKNGRIVMVSNTYISNVKPGETPFELRVYWDEPDFDTVELFASDAAEYSHEENSAYVPETNPVNENVIKYTVSSAPVQGGSASASLAAPEESTASDFETFMKKMDDYEAFFDAYCEFMKTYDSSDPAQVTKYVELLGKYTEALNGINGLNTSEMTAEEQAYYMEVMLRISQKLQEVTNN